MQRITRRGLIRLVNRDVGNVEVIRRGRRIKYDQMSYIDPRYGGYERGRLQCLKFFVSSQKAIFRGSLLYGWGGISFDGWDAERRIYLQNGDIITVDVYPPIRGEGRIFGEFQNSYKRSYIVSL